MSAPTLDRPLRPAPTGGRRSPRRRWADRRRAGQSLLVGIGVCGAATALTSVLRPGGWLVEVLVGVGLVTAVVALGRLLRVHGALVVAAAALVAGWYLAARFGSPDSGFAPLPGAGVLDRWVELVGEARTQIHDGVAPVTPGDGLTMLVLLLCLALLVAADLGIGLGSPMLVAAALSTLWLPAIGLGRPAPWWSMVAAGLPWLMLTGQTGTPTRRRPLVATAWAAGLIAVTLVAAPLVRSLPFWGTVSLSLVGTSNTSMSLSDDLDLRQDLTQRSNTTVLTYRLSGSDLSATDVGPLRAFTLADFDGTRWSEPSTDDAPDPWLAQSLGLDGSDGVVPGDTTTRVDVTVAALSDRYLPLVDGTFAISADAGLRVAGGGVVLDGLTTPGMTYGLQATVPQWTAAELADDDTSNLADAARYLTVPQGQHRADLVALAAQVAQGQTTAFGKALALQDYLRSPLFSYDVQVPATVSEDAVWDFLTARRGYCVHFATAMVLMARSLGLPARVAVGFLPGAAQGDGSYQVTGKRAHAWPELWLDGAGWVRFEPTPAVQSGPAPAWTSTGVAVTTAPTEQPSTTASAAQTSAPSVSASAAAPPTATDHTDRDRTRWWWLGVPALLLVAGAAAAVLWWRRRRARAAPLDPERALVRARAVCARAGLGWSPATTPAAVPAVVTAAARRRAPGVDVGPLSSSLSGVCAAVEQHRYARDPEAFDEQQLRGQLDVLTAEVTKFTRSRT